MYLNGVGRIRKRIKIPIFSKNQFSSYHRSFVINKKVFFVFFFFFLKLVMRSTLRSSALVESHSSAPAFAKPVYVRSVAATYSWLFPIFEDSATQRKESARGVKTRTPKGHTGVVSLEVGGGEQGEREETASNCCRGDNQSRLHGGVAHT